VVDAIIAWDLPTPWYGLAPPADTKPADYQVQARKILDQAIDKALGPGPGRPVELRPISAHGHPAAVLLEAAAGAQLLVVGNRGHGGFKEALLGSVGQHCVQHAPCPVVVIRGFGGA
jgi:nucleotide-binding universal stress UspA family protein